MDACWMLRVSFGRLLAWSLVCVFSLLCCGVSERSQPVRGDSDWRFSYTGPVRRRVPAYIGRGYRSVGLPVPVPGHAVPLLYRYGLLACS